MHPLFNWAPRGVIARRTRVAAAAAAAIATLALGLGTAGASEVSVTRQQADAAVRAAAAEEPLVRIVETVVWSEPPGGAPEAMAAEAPDWFPALAEDDLALPDAPVAATSFKPNAYGGGDDDIALNPIAREHTVIPLPPAAWTGVVGLASLATIRARKAIARFFT